MNHITLITFVLLAAVAVAVAPALAQHDHAAAPPTAKSGTAVPKPGMTDGIVKRIDKVSGRVTIAHEAIRNLDMPKMTMTFRVKDLGWLDRMKEGERIRFAAANPNGVLTIVAYEPR